MNPENDRKHTYLPLLMCILACVALAFLYVLLDKPKVTPVFPPEYDEDRLLAEAEELIREGGEQFEEGRKLLDEGPEQREKSHALMEKAYNTFEKAHALLWKIVTYREEHGLEVEGTKADQLLRGIEMNLYPPHITPGLD